MRTILAAALLVAFGCQQAPPVPFLEDQPKRAEPGLYWPKPPAEARISYLGQISGAEGFTPRGSLVSRLLRRVLGRTPQRFVRPSGLCVLGSRLVVADPGQGAVHVLDLERRRWTTVTSAPGGPLRSPVDVACLPGGEILVSDSARDSLSLHDAAGQAKRDFTEVRLERPTGLALDRDQGRIWVTETAAHRISAFDLSGHPLGRFGSRGSDVGQFNYPTMLALDPTGGLWVTDSLNFRVQHLDDRGRVDSVFGSAGDRAGAFARPRGLAVDAQGRVFVVDALFDAVQVFDPDGRLLLVFGEKGHSAGQFWLPADITMDGENRIYVADSYNRRVQIFQYHPPDAE